MKIDFSNFLSTSFNPSCNRTRRLWVSLFFLSFFAVGMNIYKDYGVSWDEPAQRNTGMVSLKYVGEMAAPEFIAGDKTFELYPPLSEYYDKDYGVAFELPLGLLESLLGLNAPRDIFYFRHLMTFLAFFAGVFAVFKLAERRFSDWRIGIVAALFVILNPRLFAESFYNDKDLVFMALFAISLNTTVLFLRYPTIRLAFWHGLATAVLIDVRIMGIIIPAVTIVFMLWRLARGELIFRPVAISLLLYVILSMILVTLFWPYLWSAPWENFSQAFVNMSKFRWGYSMLYLGHWIDATELPWHYIPVWIGITTPLFYMLFFLLGLFAILRQVVCRRWRLWQDDAEWQDILFLGLFISPVLAVILLGSVLYDGWRQLYFIYPAFVLVMMRGWVGLLHWKPARYPRLSPNVVIFATLAIFISMSVWMFRSHPFQNVYFNTLAGRDVKTKFDVDYWGLSSRQALQYIVDHDNRLTITVWAGSFLPLENGTLLMSPDDRQRLEIIYKKDRADYIVTQYRHNLTDYSTIGIPYRTFYQIDVDNEPIISVFKRVAG